MHPVVRASIGLSGALIMINGIAYGLLITFTMSVGLGVIVLAVVIVVTVDLFGVCTMGDFNDEFFVLLINSIKRRINKGGT